MKTRQGFVSNSSSSSFIIVASKEDFDKVYETLDPLEKDVIAWAKEDSNIGKTEVVGIHDYSGNTGWTLDEYNPGDGNTGYTPGSEYEEDLSSIIPEFCEKLEQVSSGNVFKQKRYY